MKILIVLVIGWLGSALAVLVQDNWQQGKTEEVIKGFERELSAAFLRGDTAFVDSNLSDDYIEITPQGSISTKKDVMALVRARAAAPRAESIGPEVTIEGTRVSTYGDTAILVGLKRIRYQHMQYQVSPEPGQSPPQVVDQERFMKVFVKKNGRWRLVAAQTTPVIKSQPS